MQKLKECMLSVGARLTPDHRAGGIVHTAAVATHRLAVALHVALLEVSSKPAQMLIVREQGKGRGTQEVPVPDPEEADDNRHVLVERSALEMLVHLVGALEQLTKALEPDGEHDRQADSGPQAIA